MLSGFVRYGVRFSAARMDVESAAFLVVQRAGAASPEDGNLIAFSTYYSLSLLSQFLGSNSMTVTFFS
jgi:hypothetical protein